MVIVAVLVVTVRFVMVPQFQAAPVPVIVIAEAPKVRVRALALDELRDPHEQVCPLVLRVPVVRVAPPTTVEPTNRWVRVKSDLLTVIVLAFAPAVAIVTVAAVPELASKVTSSDDVGTAAPPPPPEVVDQWVVVVLSQVPVPPTQNRAAILAAYSSNST
jgi:hypothetical protein